MAEREGLLAFIEVKARATLGSAAESVSTRQQARLLAAADCWLAQHAPHGAAGIRFDLILVDRQGRARRITDAFRESN